MSKLTVTKVAAPATPAANKSSFYVDTADRRAKQIDDNGLISTLNNAGSLDQNILNNGGFSIQQRVAAAATNILGVSATTAAGVVADRWRVTVGNVTTPQWTQVDAGAAPETGLLNRYYGKITQNTNAAKFILSQFLLNQQIAHLRGQKVRLSCKLKQFVGSNANYRLGLLQLNASGTIDVQPTFISAIGGASGENGTISGVALTIASTANWVRSSCVFTVPTTALNLCVVIYRDTIGAASDVVGIAEVQLTQGPDLVDFVVPFPDTELVRCQRFFCKSFPQGVVPAASLSEATAGSGATGLIGKAGATALAANYGIQFPVTMWKTPTITYFTPTAAGAQCWRFSGAAAAAQTATASRTNSVTTNGVVVTATGDASGAVGDLVGVHYTADSEFLT
jgi:hypothetical protein